MLLKMISSASSSGDPSEDDHSPAESSPKANGHRCAHRAPVTVLLADEAQIADPSVAAFAPEDDIAVIGRTPDCDHVFELAARLRPHVVIITVRMALRMGLESTRLVLHAKCGARLLVLVPQCDSAFVRHVVAAGASGYLTGRNSYPRLAKAIRDACLKKQPVCGAIAVSDESHGPSHGRDPPIKGNTELTVREREALQLIAQGHANKQIADKMCISIKTVEKHRQHLMDKLDIHETATLTRYAIYAGIAE